VSGNGLGVVAIGRNEGDRLRRCLVSLREQGAGASVVYVDSDSTDGSAALARSMSVEVVLLDMSKPFTAARARNAGFSRLVEIDPEVKYVQFLDGDCEVAEGWLKLARRTLEEQSAVAVVFGSRRERYPEKSIYNRMADVEWNVPIGWTNADGVSEACGGDAVVRSKALLDVGGYDPTIPAGEEPELCQRLRAKAWLIVRLDSVMTWHDSAMFHFRQWAKRQFRTGYGGLDFSTRFGRPGSDPFHRQILSARAWGWGWPLALAVGLTVVAALGVTRATIAIVGMLALAPLLQAARIAWKNRDRAGSLRTAILYGVLTVLGKPLQAAGQCLYFRDHRRGRHARLIEYKTAEPVPTAQL
jgi:glycosyltransferase involved in cell wall biosynthesis